MGHRALMPGYHRQMGSPGLLEVPSQFPLPRQIAGLPRNAQTPCQSFHQLGLGERGFDTFDLVAFCEQGLYGPLEGLHFFGIVFGKGLRDLLDGLQLVVQFHAGVPFRLARSSQPLAAQLVCRAANSAGSSLPVIAMLKSRAWQWSLLVRGILDKSRLMSSTRSSVGMMTSPPFSFIAAPPTTSGRDREFFLCR